MKVAGELRKPLKLRGELRIPTTLSPRQLQAAEMAARGVPTQQIAAAMSITVGTLKVYIWQAFQILGVKNRAQLAGVIFPVRNERLDLLMGADPGGTVRMGAFE